MLVWHAHGKEEREGGIETVDTLWKNPRLVPSSPMKIAQASDKEEGGNEQRIRPSLAVPLTAEGWSKWRRVTPLEQTLELGS